MNLELKSIVLCFLVSVVVCDVSGQKLPFDTLILKIQGVQPNYDSEEFQELLDETRSYHMNNDLEWDLGALYKTWGNTYLDNFWYDSAIRSFDRSITFTILRSDSLELARLYFLQGIAQEGNEQYVLSTGNFQNSLQLHRLLGNREEVGHALLEIGNNYYYSGDHQIAFIYFDRAEEIYKEVNNVEKQAKVVANRASLYNMIGKNDSALYHYEIASDLISNTDFFQQQVDIAIGLGIVYDETGKLEEAYREYQKAYTLANQYDYDSELVQIVQNLGYYFLAAGQLDSAEWYAMQTLENARTRNSFQLWSNGYEILHQVYYRQGRLKEAYDFLEELREELDSVFNESTSRQLNSMYAQYEIEKNKNDLAQLQLELQNQTIETRRIQNFRNLLIVFLVAAVFIVMLVIRGQKLKDKANKLLKKKNEEIKAKNEEIHKIEGAKNKWFLNIAHDLRTPITLVKGPLQQLHKMDYLKGDDKTLMDIAFRSIHQLETLTNEILDLSKLEHSQIKLKKEKVDVALLAEEVVASFKTLAEKREISIGFAETEEKPLWADIDREKIRKVFNNLLSNAIRFTPIGGEIKVLARANNKSLFVSFRDTGVGIQAIEHSRIFERFYQGSNQEQASSGGSGIGLAFSREIVQMHGGEIRVESQVGKGSIFEVILPLGTSTNSKSPSKPEKVPVPHNGKTTSRFKGKLIYLADDNIDMREYLVGFLAEKFTVQQFRDGRELMESMTQQSPDLIISDIMMPRLDGYSLAEKIKENASWKKIPFIAVTAVLDEKVKMDTLRIGVDDYIVKPFNPEELMIRIDNLLINYENRSSLTSMGSELESFEEKLLSKLEKEVKSQLSNPDLNVFMLASSISISERQLYRYVKQSTGFTPANFIKEIRLQRAFELARRNVYHTTAELAYAVGFKHPNYFARVFRTRFGKNPSDFLRESK